MNKATVGESVTCPNCLADTETTDADVTLDTIECPNCGTDYPVDVTEPGDPTDPYRPPWA